MLSSSRYHERLVAMLLCILAFSAQGQVAARPTLDAVRDRGALRCGVSEGLAGFSSKKAARGWQGFDVDYCRAVASAIFGDPKKVEYVPLSATDRIEAVVGGKIDVLSRTTTWTMSRDVAMDVDFVGVWYFDFQGFMVNQSTGPLKLEDMNDIQICALRGTTVEQNLSSFLSKSGIKASILLVKERRDAREYYESGLCKAYADDISTLAAERTRLSQPKSHIFLSPVISKEPLGPVVRADDPKWRELLQWVLFCLINAEEAGWTSEEAATANLPPKLDPPREATERLGLPPQWARAVVRDVGNYGEIFERNLGTSGELGLSRGFNKLWLNGGLIFAPPMH